MDQLRFDLPIQGLIEPADLYEMADEQLLKVFREDRRVERKPVGVQPRELGDLFSEFANTPGGGLIAVGVENDGLLSGCKCRDSAWLNKLEHAGDIYCSEASYEYKRVAVSNKNGERDFVLLIYVRFSAQRVVKTSDGKAFYRHGESKRRLSTDEIRELELERGQVDFENERSLLAYPDDFVNEMIENFCNTMREASSLRGKQTNEEILTSRTLGKIVNGAFQPNNACALVFASNPLVTFPGSKIRFLRYDGEKEAVQYIIKDRTIEGNIPFQIQTAERILSENLREFQGVHKGLFSVRPEYPQDAWYEAIVNACVHRSYALRTMPIFVKMFDDRLEIISPGGFLPFVTPENIYTTHRARNPHMMDVLRFLKFVRCMAEGTRRMRDTMTEMKLPPPEFKPRSEDFPQVQVTLRNDLKQRKVWIDSAAAGFSETDLDRLTKEEKRALNYVAEHGSINVTKLMRLLEGRTWKFCKNHLSTLCGLGYLKHIHSDERERDPNAHYVLGDRAKPLKS
jgi:ATP-dependent DNA helicase RecG